MTDKLGKSNLLPIGVISALSVSGLLFGSLAANAQVNNTPLDNSPNQIDGTDRAPTDFNQPATQPNQPLSQPQNQPLNQPLNQPDPNITPSTPSTLSPLSEYSPDRAPVLGIGSRGNAVRDVQAFLSQQGLYNGAADGVYGYRTQEAVRQFQRSQNLSADGVIGPRTWGAMTSPSGGAMTSPQGGTMTSPQAP